MANNSNNVNIQNGLIKINENIDIKSDRIKSIDILKGIAIFWIIGGHVCWYWLVEDSLWIHDFLLVFIFWPITAVNFVMLSGTNLAISVSSKRDNNWNNKQIRSYTLRRLVILLLLSIFYNFMIGLFAVEYEWYYMYAWFILQTIGTSLTILIFMVNISRTLKIILGILIILISYPLHFLLISLGYHWTLVDYLLFYPFDKFPFLPWGGLTFIGYYIGEIFYDVKYRSKKGQETRKMRSFILYLLLIGAGFIAFGIIMGSNCPSTNPYDSYWYNLSQFHIQIMSVNPLLTFQSLPFFILKGHWTFMFYSLGIDFILLSILTYFCDYRKANNSVLKFFSFSGQMAFSIFFYHHIGIPLLYRTLDFIWAWPVWISYAILIIGFVWLLVKKYEGVGTIEWLMILITYKQKLKIEYKVVQRSNII
ncbi:MAG: heparan-alpha-glucosaminide N-acetyltransferase domain-containing protein [Candidatus Helarchaeota archaeon]